MVAIPVGSKISSSELELIFANWVFLLFHHIPPAEFGLETCYSKSTSAGSSSNRADVLTDNRVSLPPRNFTPDWPFSLKNS